MLGINWLYSIVGRESSGMVWQTEKCQGNWLVKPEVAVLF